MTPNRRHILGLLAGGLASPAFAQAPAMNRLTAYAFSFQSLGGTDIRFADYAGKPVLVVNTASQCGYTPQLAGLQKLWATYHDRGLMIIGVPSNDFGQEPLAAADVSASANHDYGVTFPLTVLSGVKGASAHPFYKWAAAERHDPPRWNFHKYLVSHDGHLAAVFATEIEPTDPRVVAAIERELSAE